MPHWRIAKPETLLTIYTSFALAIWRHEYWKLYWHKWCFWTHQPHKFVLRRWGIRMIWTTIVAECMKGCPTTTLHTPLISQETVLILPSNSNKVCRDSGQSENQIICDTQSSYYQGFYSRPKFPRFRRKLVLPVTTEKKKYRTKFYGISIIWSNLNFLYKFWIK
jgi:hypothetical protein